MKEYAYICAMKKIKSTCIFRQECEISHKYVSELDYVISAIIHREIFLKIFFKLTHSLIFSLSHVLFN